MSGFDQFINDIIRGDLESVKRNMCEEYMKMKHNDSTALEIAEKYKNKEIIQILSKYDIDNFHSSREQKELKINFIFDHDPVIIKYSNVDRVSQLKEKISKISTMKIGEFILFSDKEYLEDEQFILECDISDQILCCRIKTFDIGNLGKLIDTGRVSEVYRTTRLSTGKSTIVKKYDVGSLDKFKRSGALLNELKRCQCTKSNSTFIQLIGMYCEDRYFYVEMEDTEGDSMRDYLKENYPIEDTQMTKWSKQILEGLNHLHRNGIYYRDLKATDILLDKTYNVKISGFGLSKYILGIDSQEMLAEIETRNTSCISYSAPELMNNQLIGPYTDVWSLGAIFYRMVTNKTPYHNMNYNDVMRNISNNRSIELEYSNKKTNPKLKSLICSCLHHEPADRPTIDQLLQDVFQNMVVTT